MSRAPIRPAIERPRAAPAASAIAIAQASPASTAARMAARSVGRPVAAAARASIARIPATVSRQPVRPQRQRSPVVVDDDVADLAGAGAVALEQRAAEDQPGADAAPDADRDQVRDAVPAGVRVLGEGGRLRVVGDVDRDAVALGDDLAERQVAPVEVDRAADRAGPAVDEAGRPDPDAEQRRGAAVEELVEEVEDEGEGGVAVAAVDRQLDGPADLAAEVDERAREVLLAEVEPDDEARVVVDLEEDRGLAAARRAAPDLADDAVVEKGGDRRPRRWSGSGR